MSSDRQQGRGALTILGEALRRRPWVVVACALLVPAVTLGLSLAQPKRYRATASLLFRDPGLERVLFRSPPAKPGGDPAREAETNRRLVSLHVVAQRTADRLGGDLTADAVSDRVDVRHAGASNLISVAATDRSPMRSARIANAFASEYIAYRQQADRAQIREAQRLVARDLSAVPPGPEARRLRERAKQLQLLASLQTGNAELAQPAVPPTDASSPKVLGNTLVGGVLGLLLGMGLALLFDRVDRRLRDEEEIGEAYGRPVLGTVPQTPTIAGAGVTHHLTRADAEAFRTLRANLRYFNVGSRLRSIAVASAMPGEGKTTVAWNLALAAAISGQRTLLIEADLRRPGFASRLGSRAKKGLSTLVVTDAALGDVAEDVVLDYDYAVADFGLSVVQAGPLPPNPAELLETERMSAILKEAEKEYELVVVDTPPLTVVPDATALLRRVDGTMIVARLGTTTRDAAAHLRSHLDNLHAKVLGVVVNSTDVPADHYGYAHERDAAMTGAVRVRIPTA